MKFLSWSTAILFLGFGAGRAAAQNCVATALSVIPSCAQNCIINGATAVGCGGVDFGCQCQKTAALFAAVDSCVSASCPSASYQAVIDGASTVCGCAAPTAGGLATGTASVSGISAISGISGTVPASNTATATGTVVSATATAGSPTTSGAVPTGSVSSSGLSTVTSSSASGTGGLQGNGNTWTGYTSVSNVATASVVGGVVAQATPDVNILRFFVPVAMVGAAML